MPGPFEHFFQSPFWGRGFRPFFFLGALYTVIAMAIWGGFYAGHIMPPLFMVDPVSWHAHEMIYGFTVAIIAGFLLTAVANWTGGAPARQVHLAGLCALWLAGRVVMNVDLGLPLWLIYTVDAAFIPALALSLAIPLLRSWNKRNFVFLCLLGILFACNLWFLIGQTIMPLYIAIMMILMMISLIGGRIIPAFTVAGLRRKGIEAFQTDQRKTDMAALASLVFLTILLPITNGQGYIFAAAAFVASFIHTLRMRHYHVRKALTDPMIWVLHAGYIWLVLGLLGFGLAGLGITTLQATLHILTAGTIGTMTLGMMCRVSLGHTGRDLNASPATIWAFGLMIAAALIRVCGPLFFNEYATESIILSATLWSCSFLIYLFVYTPMLIGPRPDGRDA